MPTKQFEPLLYRELRRAEAKDLIGIASPLLQEEVNYATNTFQRCKETASRAATVDELVPVFASYYHVIGMTDGIEVLISQSCPIAAIPLLRSSFEALLAVEYILEEDCQRRAFAWTVCRCHDVLGLYELLDTSRPRGREFSASLPQDVLNQYKSLQSPRIAQVIQNVESRLKKPDYEAAENEYQRLRKGRGSVNWYTLFGGPANLRGLCERLNRKPTYDIFYRSWSNAAHAGDLLHLLTRTGPLGFNPLRSPEKLLEVAGHASAFILDATKLILTKYRAGELASFEKWYKSEIRDGHLALNTTA